MQRATVDLLRFCSGLLIVVRAIVATTLPPTFIQRERTSELEFCRVRRVMQRGPAWTFSDCAGCSFGFPTPTGPAPNLRV